MPKTEFVAVTNIKHNNEKVEAGAMVDAAAFTDSQWNDLLIAGAVEERDAKTARENAAKLEEAVVNEQAAALAAREQELADRQRALEAKEADLQAQADRLAEEKATVEAQLKATGGGK